MDEGRKRVIGIIAAILTSLHMQTADDLFGGPQGSPRTDKLIAASVRNERGPKTPFSIRWGLIMILSSHDRRICLATW
jgi:hypothetical protein